MHLFLIAEDALKAAIGLVSEYISSEWSKKLYEIFDIPYPTAYVIQADLSDPFDLIYSLQSSGFLEHLF